MTWRTSTFLVKIRNIARKAGLTRMVGRLLAGQRYEQAFDDAIFATLRPGDVVWDVGANVGYYTKRFAQAIAPLGKVIAFEPFPDTANRLRTNLEGVENYLLRTVALGAASGRVTMQLGGDDLGATNRIVERATQGVAIEIQAGDDLLAAGSVEAPNVIKIDTEGFELDVIRGMKSLLASHKLRALFIEVHFGILAERGMSSAPAEIERELRFAGFATRWVDSSHIAAVRRCSVA